MTRARWKINDSNEDELYYSVLLLFGTCTVFR